MRSNKADKMYIITLLIAVAFYLPFFIIGGGIHPIIHDQFDGDLLTYIIQARDLSLSNLPQFMDGTKSSLTMPAPGFIMLFILFKPLTAYKIMQLTEIIVGATGMYFLAKKLGATPLVRIAISVMFITIPFYTVYGLTIMGLPLLACALLDVAENNKLYSRLIICGLYAAFSSLVLAGYCVIIILFFAIVMLFVQKKWGKAKRLLIAMICIGGVYALVNINLFTDFLKPTEASHREEFINQAELFKNSFWSMIKDGTNHEGSIHYRIFCLAIPMTIYCIIDLIICRFLKKKIVYKTKIALLVSVIAVLGISVFYGLWHSSSITAWKNSVGGIAKSFQFDRFYFLNPLFWYILLTCILIIIEQDAARVGVIAAKIGIVVQVIIIAWCGIYNIENNISLKSDWNALAANLGRQLFSENVSNITWNNFWDTDNFNDVSSYIKDKYDQEKGEYKVVSVGMYPSVPLYNGFYCADGYSNNYTLEYKHRFGKLIEPELQKSSKWSSYFYNWGNRCYVFSDELDSYFYNKDSGAMISDLQLNPKAMQDLDISYVISAVPINNYQEINLNLEKEFVSESTCYHLYLYKTVLETK